MGEEQRVDESEGCLLGAASEFNQLQGASFGEEVKLQFLQGVGKNQKNEQDHQEHVHQEQDDQESESG